MPIENRLNAIQKAYRLKRLIRLRDKLTPVVDKLPSMYPPKKQPDLKVAREQMQLGFRHLENGLILIDSVITNRRKEIEECQKRTKRIPT